MKIQVVSCLLLTALVSQACSKSGVSKSRSTGFSNSVAGIPKVVCESGDPAFFIMQDTENKNVPPSAFPAIPYFTTIETQPIADFKARLDVCVVDDSPTLKQVVLQTSRAPQFMVVAAEKDSKILGLKEAIFDQDYSKLEIEVLDRNMNIGMYVRGSTDGKVALIADLYKENGVWSGQFGMTETTVSYGAFEFKDPQIEGSCDDVANVTRTLVYGTATFTFKGIAPTTNVNGSFPRVCGVAVVDSSPRLGVKAGLPVKIELPFDKTNNAVFRFSGTHHGECDLAWIKTPQAEYGLRLGFAACIDPTFEGFPSVGLASAFKYGSEIVTQTEEDYLKNEPH